MKDFLAKYAAKLDRIGLILLRFSIVIVFLWIGGLKFFSYEADGIVPFVANSPMMSFFYRHPEQYKEYTNKEGELSAKNRQWHVANNTYGFAKGLGVFLIICALLVALHSIFPFASMIGSILIFLMTIGTLSFLITTPESWVPDLGDDQWGAPFLSSRGRLVLKDIVILAGAVLTMSESAKLYLSRAK
ncbi:YkgB family protein [Dyadobacter sp. CY261]|uniref:DUF417 family protein n=1 Tax=Dyadobacter sp. CY261 TaxID=2907203 RepID=UPI001F3C2EDE|nr:DUF417 family protein [Dyadobacter sp. CY261]MCF0074225.1 YkgB family protein [Dyadobacter sp. CY261]